MAYTDHGFLGVPTNHHSTTHHGDTTAAIGYLTQIEQWAIDRMGDIARGLSSTTEAYGSSVLDNTMLMLATDFADGNQHEFGDMPGLVMGGEAGGVVHGRHLRIQRQPHSNLWLTAMDFMGLPDVSFGRHATVPVDLS